jgi:hypothetical protein
MLGLVDSDIFWDILPELSILLLLLAARELQPPRISVNTLFATQIYRNRSLNDLIYLYLKQLYPREGFDKWYSQVHHHLVTLRPCNIWCMTEGRLQEGIGGIKGVFVCNVKESRVPLMSVWWRAHSGVPKRHTFPILAPGREKFGYSLPFSYARKRHPAY